MYNTVSINQTKLKRTPRRLAYHGHEEFHFLRWMKRKLNTVAFEGVGKEIYERNGMTVHGSSATNPQVMVLRVLQFGQYAALFQFSTYSNEGQGRSWHSNTYYIIWRCQKKKKAIQRTRTSLYKQQKVGVSFRNT